MERFSSAATLAQPFQGFHMERALLLTPARPGVALFDVPSLTLTNSKQRARFYLIR